MPTIGYLKIPRDRIGVLIGKNGEIRQKIENITRTSLNIDSKEGTVTISPTEAMEDFLGVWKTNNVVKAIGRGFNPDTAIRLIEDDTYLEIIKLTLHVGKSKKALSRQKGRIIGKNGRTREIITKMAEVSMAIYGNTVAFVGELENVMIAKKSVEMLLNGSQHKSIYSFLESKQNNRKIKEFKSIFAINDDNIKFRDDLDN